MSSESLHLDPAIRDYVLLPIVVLVVLTSLLRSNLTTLFGKPAAAKPPTLEELKFLTLFARISKFRENADILSDENFKLRKRVFAHLLSAVPPTQLSPMEKMMEQNQDPSAALNMVKSQFMFLGIHGGIGYLVSSLFSGFLVAKTPFPLTFKIKGMLQRGVEVPALDTSYVSSLSWYFFIMISISGLLGLWNYLVYGEYESSGEDQQAMMAAMGGMAHGPAMAPAQIDIPRQIESEKENLQVISHTFSVKIAEIELLEGSWANPAE
jgi:ER membrane protein complex subunit 3